MSEKTPQENLLDKYINPNLHELELWLKKPTYRNAFHPWLKANRELLLTKLIWATNHQERDIWAGQIQMLDMILGLRTVVDYQLKAAKRPEEKVESADWEMGLDDSTGLNPNADLEDFS